MGEDSDEIAQLLLCSLECLLFSKSFVLQLLTFVCFCCVVWRGVQGSTRPSELGSDRMMGLITAANEKMAAQTK